MSENKKELRVKIIIIMLPIIMLIINNANTNPWGRWWGAAEASNTGVHKNINIYIELSKAV